MARIVQIKWTGLQREIATLAQQGKKFDALVELGYTKSLVSKVLNAIKSGQKPPEGQEPGVEEQERGKGKQEPKPKTSKPPVISKDVEVGKITITPENWGMTQYGALVVIDTYNKSKRAIGYTGTIGDFLCDICVFYRRVLNYEEVEYVRTTGEGGGGTEENGERGAGVKELAEGERRGSRSD